MNCDTGCYSCLMRQAEDLFRMHSLSAERSMELAGHLFRFLGNLDLDRPTPFIGRELHRELARLLSIEDPYLEAKKMSNEIALELTPYLRKAINGSNDPLALALAISASGNLIDMGAPGSSRKEDIEESLREALDLTLDNEILSRFKNDMEEAENILLLADNAGEIIFDRLLVEQLPPGRVTCAVRGGPIINDALTEDARSAGMEEVARLISTGDNTPGIDFTRSSEELIQALGEADCVLAKGQGNFETLYDTDWSTCVKGAIPVYFLFRVKCDRVSAITEMDKGTSAFLRRTLQPV